MDSLVEGALVIEVHMELADGSSNATTAFIPKNPFVNSTYVEHVHG